MGDVQCRSTFTTTQNLLPVLVHASKAVPHVKGCPAISDMVLKDQTCEFPLRNAARKKIEERNLFFNNERASRHSAATGWRFVDHVPIEPELRSCRLKAGNTIGPGQRPGLLWGCSCGAPTSEFRLKSIAASPSSFFKFPRAGILTPQIQLRAPQGPSVNPGSLERLDFKRPIRGQHGFEIVRQPPLCRRIALEIRIPKRARTFADQCFELPLFFG